MKLEQQVCSLELSKRLKELGVKQESWFWWNSSKRNKEDTTIYLKDGHGKEYYFSDDYNELERWGGTYDIDLISAFTVAELGKILPGQLHNFESKEHAIHQYISEKSATFWHSAYVCAGCKGKLGSVWAETEADARAKMLILLLENKLLDK